MAFKTVSLESIKNQYDSYVINKVINTKYLDSNYIELRNFCIEKYYSIKKEIENNKSKNKSALHELDMRFGMELFVYLKGNDDFLSNKTYETNYDFWRYLSVFVIPDIITDRWGIDKVDHFYKKATAIYPFQVYWYINMSWQGTVEKTYDVLAGNQEDHILQLVDRPSSIGVNLDLYRCIMRENSKIPVNERKEKFRAVMTNNTSKLVNIRPELFPGGIEKYTEMIFSVIK